MTLSRRATTRAVPTVVLSRPILWEVADIVEQIFRIAFVENLHPRPEDYDAATVDYRAACGLSDSAMREILRSSSHARVRERAQVIALMRLYRARWRVWDPEGPRARIPSRQPQPCKAGKNRMEKLP